MSTGQHNNQYTSQVGLTERQPRRPRVGLRSGKGKRYTLAERLTARTVKGPSCWIVQGYQNPHGYVMMAPARKGDLMVYAHRVAYELAHGPIPPGMVVMHSCDNPRCVNPAHLSVGTQAQNIIDSIQKGRYNAFGRQKLDAAKVREIRALWAQGWTQKAIAAKFGVQRHSISGVVHFKSWQHVDALSPVLERVPFVLLPVRGEVA